MRERKRILIVSGDDRETGTLEGQLVPRGYSVTRIDEGGAVPRVAAEINPDLILVDAALLGGIDGFEVCSKLREKDSTRNIPILLMLADSTDETAIRLGFETGANDYISKRAKPEELTARLEAMGRIRELQESRVERERMQALIEMAGAAVHEMSQPLTALQGVVDILAAQGNLDDGTRRRLDLVRECGRKMGEILEKFRKVERYETKHYLDGVRIVDLEKASQSIDFDPLTGLYSRSFLYRHLKEELERASRSGIPVCCILIQMDEMEQLKRRFDSKVRDEWIRRYASSLQKLLRKNDYLIRYGEAEFIVILHNNTVNGSKVLAERIRAKSRDLNYDDLAPGTPLSVSGGISCFPADTPEGDVDALIQNAGIALRTAQREGGNSFRAFIDVAPA